MADGQGNNKRYWQCRCCAHLMVTDSQDDATTYQCPQCYLSKCDDGGKYEEITSSEFIKECELI